MQENEFEKQLKHVMEDFKITPPASAWDNISRRLDKKRRPRLPFFFLLAVGLFVTGYFVFRVYEKQTPQTASVADHNKNNNGTSLQKTDSLYAKRDHTADLSSTSTVTTSKKSDAEESGLKEFKAVVNNAIRTTSISGKNNAAIKQHNLIENTQQAGDINDESHAITANKYPEKNDLNAAKQPETITQTADTLATNSNSANNLLKPGSGIDTATNANIASTKKTYASNTPSSKWRFGITVFYGKSNAVNALVGSEKAALSNAFSPGSLSGVDTGFQTGKHPYTSSDAYQFGITVQRNIIKNGFLSAGLNFTHLSTRSDISKEVNSTYIIQNFDRSNSFYTLSSYYQPGAKNNFINKYNFIELPVYFQHDLFAANKFSFSYNAGFSIRYLLSSDALIYNEHNSIYFSQEDQLRKAQLQFLAGASLKYKASKTASLYIGPQFSYSFSNMLKNENNGNFHFITYGVQAGLILQKR